MANGMEPGRPKIEEREAQYIWNGTRVLLGSGVEYTVLAHEDHNDDTVTLHLSRTQNNGQVSRIRRPDTDLIRCRVEDEDR